MFFEILKKNGFRQTMRYERRKHGVYTPREKLNQKYNAKLFALIGSGEAYYNLYKLSPEEAAAKGII